MRYCNNDQLNRFVEDFVSYMKGVNKDEGNKYDIPFMIASICQSFDGEESKYINFISERKDIDSLNHYYFQDLTPNNPFIETMTFDVLTPFTNRYILEISYDDRYESYCMCDESMDGYREDKHCCGDGCDWVAPMFELYKLSLVEDSRWIGKERDYWEFEDKYYGRNLPNDKNNSENNNVDKEKTIEEIRKQLIELQNKLYQLEK